MRASFLPGIYLAFLYLSSYAAIYLSSCSLCVFLPNCLSVCLSIALVRAKVARGLVFCSRAVGGDVGAGAAGVRVHVCVVRMPWLWCVWRGRGRVRDRVPLFMPCVLRPCTFVHL